MATFEGQDHKENEKHADGIIEDRKQAPPPYFTILFFGLILWGVAFCSYYLLSGWSSEGEFTQNMTRHEQRYAAQPEADSPAIEEQVDAAALYAELCSVCHAADGKGGIGPDLTGTYKFGKGVSEISTSISSGRPGGMPAFGTQLSKSEIGALADYLINL